MTTTRTPTRTKTGVEEDRRAMAIARAIFDGDLDEQTGRWELCTVLLDSGVANRVATKLCQMSYGTSSGYQRIDDYTQVLTDLLIDKIAGENPALDIARIASGGSFCGWAYNFAASPHSRQTLSRKSKSGPILLSPISAASEIASGSPQQGSPTPFDIDSRFNVRTNASPDDNKFDVLASSYAERASRARTDETVHLAAQMLATAYNVRLPIRGIDLPRRNALLKRLRSSDSAVQDDLLDTIEDFEAGYRGLAAVFAGQSAEELEVLAELPAIVTQRLALASLTPVPPPRSKQVLTLRDAIIDATSSGQKPLGKHKAGSLARTFAAVFSEAQGSQYGQHEDPSSVKPLSERQEAQREWQDTITQLIDDGMTEFGLTADEVMLSMSIELDRISVDRSRECVVAGLNRTERAGS